MRGTIDLQNEFKSMFKNMQDKKRGTNERTNALVRRWISKGSSMKAMQLKYKK